MKPEISVVIPTYRRPQQLRRCLESLARQDFPAGQREIIVVDDAHLASTRQWVESFAKQRAIGQLRYLTPLAGHRGPAAARNAGWQAARADVVAFTDDDTLPAPDWLRAGFAALRPGIAAVWGQVLVPLPDQPTDAERNTAGLDGAEFVTANCFVRRAVLAEAGGFDERFTRPWREDSDLYFTLLEQGWKVHGAPSAVVIHPARQAPVMTCLRLHRDLFFDALLYKKHRLLYRQKIAAQPPLRYYAVVALLFLLAGSALLGQWALAGAAAGAWLALTVAFIVQRLRGLSRAWDERCGIVISSILIPPLAVFWRLAGAWHFRVIFA